MGINPTEHTQTSITGPRPASGATLVSERSGQKRRHLHPNPETPQVSAGGPASSLPRAGARLLPKTSVTAEGGVVPGFPGSRPHRGPRVSLSWRRGTGPHSLPGTQVPRSPHSQERHALRGLLTTAPRKLSRGAKTALTQPPRDVSFLVCPECRTLVMKASGARPSSTRHRKPCQLT